MTLTFFASFQVKARGHNLLRRLQVCCSCHGYFLRRTKLTNKCKPKNCEYGWSSTIHTVAPAAL
jgi:hypothetical protein